MITLIGKDTTVQTITGPAGKLEMLVSEPLATECAAVGIVCHPHPLFGGTMYNKVVTTITKAFQNLGVRTVRFNFRGVGESTGEFDGGKGELEDLLAVIKWLRQENSSRAIWLAGFSFGAYVAAQAATQMPFERLVLVAPPVVNFSMMTLPPILSPWILVQGEKDEVVQAEETFVWAERREPTPSILRFPEASHFFHGQLTELRTRLEEVLK
jgi:alpha/beta superfamily hydrolase